jgi:hypothetical protein
MAYKKTDEASRDEHAVIGGVAGKKVFIIDSNGNLIDFTNEAVEIKNATDDTRAKVGGNGLEVDVKAITFPTEYPLPTVQVTTLTPPAAITGYATSANQLPDNHQVKVSNTLIIVPFDYIGASYPNGFTEVYEYYTGGSTGTLVGTITVVYSDENTKQIITSVTKV